MPYASIGAQRIFFEDTGGDGPAVVFAHGFLMDHEMWRPYVDSLRDEFRCVTYDERGWGQTITDGEPFDYWDLADDVVGLLDHLGIDATVLVGFSQGGFCGLRLALRYPSRVRALVLADTAPHAFAPELVTVYREIFSRARETGVDDALVDTLTGLLFAPGFDAGRWVGKWRARPVADVAAAEECLVSQDEIGDRIGEVRCPVLVVHGELDAAFPLAEVDEWVGRLPGPATLLRVPGAGHSAVVEYPATVVPALRTFLEGLT